MAVDPAHVKSLFLAASDLADPAERVAYLDRECGGEAELRARVEALLRSHDASPLPAPGLADRTGPHALDAPAPAPAADDPRKDEQAGTVIAGKYTLLEVIGEGGMGSVWRARQTEPVLRFVAVKLIKAGMDSRQVQARFEAERQALALMDHPNIAKVLDGGLHEHRPFFVMELVKGVPITDFCDARKLTPKERLELFVPVCQAIQHAHQKGIIHRDIKPSNVLLALYDDKPVVKVIDFGVAKATGGTLTERTIDTAFGGVVGTPQYMSPEQATFNNLDIDTRSDVYALGVLLYELLTGSPPFARKELEKKGLLEILRVVREEEPPRPSAKLSTADALLTLSANRGTEPKKLTGLLRNELDWIVMKALEKDRTRRYETANGFAADVLRYLSGEAVVAHPPSTVYRLKKFVRRNKGQVIAASLVLFALLAGMAGTMWGLFRAEDRRQEAEQARGNEARQRQVAEAAELARRFELARTAAAAGRLAARRGQWADALQLTTTAIDLGVEDEIGLRLERLDCRLQLGQMREAKAELDALVARQDQGEYAGRILLVRADAAMGLADPGNPVEYARQALARGLPPADAAYARVYLSQTVPEAIANIQEAHRIDPARPRALDALCLLYFLTGRRVELRETLAQQKLLFPHSKELEEMEVLSAALAGDSASVSRRIAALRRPGGEPTSVSWFAPILVRMQDEDFFFQGLDPELQRTLFTQWSALAKMGARMSGQPEDGAIRVSDLNMFRLPMFRALGDMPAFKNAAQAGPMSLLFLLSQPSAMSDLFGAVAKTIPDGSFFLLQGVTAELAGRTTEAEAAYRRALDHTSFANHTKRARYGLMTARWKLAADPATPPTDRARWRELAIADMRALDRFGPLPSSPASHVVLVAFETGDYARALARIEVWQQAFPNEPASWVSKMNTEDRLGAYDRAEQTVRDFLARPVAVSTMAKEALATLARLAARQAAANRPARAAELEAFARNQLPTKVTEPGADVWWSGFLIQYLLEFERADLAMLKLDAYRVGQRARATANPTAAAAELALVGMQLLAHATPAAAEPILRDCLELRERKQADDWKTFNTQSLLGRALLGQKKYAEAEPLLLKGYEGMKQREKTIPPQGATRLPEALDRLIELCTATNKPEEAKKWRAERAKYPAEKAPPPGEKK